MKVRLCLKYQGIRKTCLLESLSTEEKWHVPVISLLWGLHLT